MKTGPGQAEGVNMSFVAILGYVAIGGIAVGVYRNFQSDSLALKVLTAFFVLAAVGGWALLQPLVGAP
jgi:hypothetical protein